MNAKHLLVKEQEGRQGLLLPEVVDAIDTSRSQHTVVCADAGYHPKKTLDALDKRNTPAWICDNGYQMRDPRYADQAKQRARTGPLRDKSAKVKEARAAKKAKIDGQWKLYCMVHNIEKLGHHGYAN